MKVMIWFDKCSLPTVYEDVLSTYQKGDLYCIRYKKDAIDKFPLDRIFRIRESEFENAQIKPSV